MCNLYKDCNMLVWRGRGIKTNNINYCNINMLNWYWIIISNNIGNLYYNVLNWNWIIISNNNCNLYYNILSWNWIIYIQ